MKPICFLSIFLNVLLLLLLLFYRNNEKKHDTIEAPYDSSKSSLLTRYPIPDSYYIDKSFLIISPDSIYYPVNDCTLYKVE